MSFPHVGCRISKPDLLSLLEPGKEPWRVEHELTAGLFSGEWEAWRETPPQLTMQPFPGPSPPGVWEWPVPSPLSLGRRQVRAFRVLSSPSAPSPWWQLIPGSVPPVSGHWEVHRPLGSLSDFSLTWYFWAIFQRCTLLWSIRQPYHLLMHSFL